MKLSEEYTGPRTCEKCEHEKDFPCQSKGCNIVNGLECFEPKGSKKTDTSCPKCSNWKTLGIGAYCPFCGEKI